jgi:hypothetical protein
MPRLRDGSLPGCMTPVAPSVQAVRVELREVGAVVMPRAALVLALASASALVLVGCSSSGTTTASNPKTTTTQTTVAGAAAIDPCTLFTPHDASRLVGKTLTHAPGGGLGKGTCAYSGGKVLIGAELTMKVDTGSAAAHAEFSKWVLPVTTTAPGFSVTTLANIGDEAKATHTSFTDSIYFRDGNVLVKIGVYPPASVAALTTAARAALDRL